MAEHVILFAGPMGAGKTTAIRSLSEIDVVSTEAANSERHLVDKATTTVALDYGEITLDADEKVRLYGVPGQRRFDFMWRILKRRARGLVLLVNDDDADPLASLVEYLGEYRDLLERGVVVIGISRSDIAGHHTTGAYIAAIGQAFPGVIVPVYTVDPRRTDQMRTLILTLVATIDARARVEAVMAR